MTSDFASVVPVLAQGEGSYIVTPMPGLMIWTLVTFLLTVGILAKFAFPRIAEALDKRRRSIEESIDRARQARREADQLLEDYRERLKEARVQAEDIVTRARKAGDQAEREALEAGRAKREELLEQARRDIQAETSRAIGEIRAEVADLTVLATEKVTRKTLTPEDQRRLVEEALGELDFSSLSQNRN